MEQRNRFSAVCLSIKVEEKVLDRDTLTALSNILRRRVQVLLNAGDVDREVAIDYVRKVLIGPLEKKTKIPFEYLKSIAVMCDGGRTIVSTSGVEENQYFDDEENFETNNIAENAMNYLEMPKADIMGLNNPNVEGIKIAQWIELSRLYPTICDQAPNQSRTTKKLAIVTNKLEGIRARELKQTNSAFNNNFEVSGGIRDVFDKSGAIEIKDHEWELLGNNNPLKNLFMERDANGRYMYSLETDNSRVLRGSSTYYYFLSHRKRTEKKDLDADAAIEWYKNNNQFLNKASQALDFPMDYDSSDAKLLLGVMDNIRNLALVTANAAIMRRYLGKTVYVSISAYKDDEDITGIHTVCKEVYEIMADICFKRPLDEGVVERIQGIIARFQPIYAKIFDDVLSTKDTRTVCKKL